jgi:nucleoside-diphosphate-sugar epimerase
VKQVIITASIVSLVASTDFWKEITISEKSYNPQTAEDALRPDAPAFLVYSVSKGLADRAVRDFKRAHRDLDLTTIHPGYIFGPLGSGQVYSSPATGSNRYIYGLIAGGAPDRPVSEYDPAVRAPPHNIDVRDVARAHVLALKAPPSDEPKRFILSSSTFTWKEAIEVIAEARPELKGRLPVITGNEPPVPPFATFDTSATESILGFKNYVKWQDTVLDTVDDLLRVEKELAASAQ